MSRTAAFGLLDAQAAIQEAHQRLRTPEGLLTYLDAFPERTYTASKYLGEPAARLAGLYAVTDYLAQYAPQAAFHFRAKPILRLYVGEHKTAHVPAPIWIVRLVRALDAWPSDATSITAAELAVVIREVTQ